MRQQNVTITSNLRFTRSGVVWADYILTGIEYGYRPDEDKHLARTMHKMLLRALPGESLLLGVCASLNPEAVVARMEDGVDLDLHPAWAAECEATLDTIADFAPGQRIYWLSIPLTTRGWKAWLSASAVQASMSLTDMLGMPRSAIDPDEVARREHQADLIIANVPAYFRPEPATPAQMVWLHQHSLQRGLNLDTDLPPASAQVSSAKNIGAFTAARLDEGAQSDRPATGWRSKAPTLSRVLKIDQPWVGESAPASYQCFLALSDTPSGGVYFPGSEYLTLADEIPGVDVDWAIMLHQRSREEVTRRNQRALINLNEQFHQRDGELSHGHSVLDAAADDLSEYAAEIESDRNEVEVQATTVFAVGADTEELALRFQNQLAKKFEESSYRLVCPLGFQEDLWNAMNPGTPRPKIVNEFAQITTSTHFSAFVPFTRNDLGDASGPLLALNISSPRIGVVHHDVATKSSGADISGSLGVAGNLGSGKSVFIKSVASSFVDRGGRVVVVDHTTSGEYAAWASTVADATIVDPVKRQYSIDPLRMFGPVRGAEIAASILMPLLQIQPDDDQGVLLSAVLSPEYRTRHKLRDGGIYELISHLAEECDDPVAQTLAKKLGVYKDKSYAASLFAPDLPPLSTSSPAIVFRTQLVALPSQHKMEKAHLFKDLRLEERVGRVMYTLIAFIAKEICFANPSEPAMWVLDECHRVTREDDGLDVAIEFVREGRKAGAFAVFGSQDPDEGMGNETLRGLIPTKVTMRQTDENLARRCLKFVGLDPTDPALLKELMEQTSPVKGRDPQTGKEYVEPHRRGEGYMRDGYGNIGRIKVLPPSEPKRRQSVMTTPESVGKNREPSLVTV